MCLRGCEPTVTTSGKIYSESLVQNRHFASTNPRPGHMHLHQLICLFLTWGVEVLSNLHVQFGGVWYTSCWVIRHRKNGICIYKPPWSHAFDAMQIFVFALMSSGDKEVACAFGWCLIHFIESYSKNNNPRITKIREWKIWDLKIREWKSETNHILVKRIGRKTHTSHSGYFTFPRKWK